MKVLGHLVKGNEDFIGIDYQLSDLYTISIRSNNILMLHAGGKSNLSFFFRGVSQNRGGEVWIEGLSPAVAWRPMLHRTVDNESTM